MKALIIASLLFFSLRAMSAEVGEEGKTDCANINQTAKREAKPISEDSSEVVKTEDSKTLSK